MLGRIAAGLKIDRQLVQDLYEVDGENIRLAVATKHLSSEKKAAMREISLLLTAGRQKGGLDANGYTSAELIVAACQDFDKYDSTNFAKHVKALESEFIIRGRGGKAELKLKQPGFEAAAELIKTLNGPKTS